MDFLSWLQDLGRTTDPLAKAFHPRPLYLLVSVAMPVSIGLAVGFGLRAIERLLGLAPPGTGGH